MFVQTQIYTCTCTCIYVHIWYEHSYGLMATSLGLRMPGYARWQGSACSWFWASAEAGSAIRADRRPVQRRGGSPARANQGRENRGTAPQNRPVQRGESKPSKPRSQPNQPAPNSQTQFSNTDLEPQREPWQPDSERCPLKTIKGHTPPMSGAREAWEAYALYSL